MSTDRQWQRELTRDSPVDAVSVFDVPVYTSRQIIATAPLTGGGPLSADVTIGADPTLGALANLDGTAGLVEQTAADTFTKRALGVAAGTSVPTRADADTRYAASAHAHAAADITSGTIAPDRLGSGSGGATKFLREDSTWQAVAGGSTPTGTGFRHVTAGVEDAASKLVDTADINDAQVTLAKLANLTGPTAIGRESGTGVPVALTAAQVTLALVNAFTDVLKGAVPASGGGTTNFLRADGSWVAPPGGGGGAETATVAVAFTDGETFRRVTVTDAAVAPTDPIVVAVRRPNIATEADDTGHVYVANVVLVGTGSFDVVIGCYDRGMGDTTEQPPNETIQLVYVRPA